MTILESAAALAAMRELPLDPPKAPEPVGGWFNPFRVEVES